MSEKKTYEIELRPPEWDEERGDVVCHRIENGAYRYRYDGSWTKWARLHIPPAYRAEAEAIWQQHQKPERPGELTVEELVNVRARVESLDDIALMQAAIAAHEERQQEQAAWDAKYAEAVDEMAEVPGEKPGSIRLRDEDGDSIMLTGRTEEGPLHINICTSGGRGAAVYLTPDQWRELRAAGDAMAAWLERDQ